MGRRLMGLFECLGVVELAGVVAERIDIEVSNGNAFVSRATGYANRLIFAVLEY